MSIKNLFRSFWINGPEIDLKLKMKLLESNLNHLKEEIKEIKDKANLKSPEQSKEPPIIIERISIEKVVLDKYEVNNNFGQLGIKELKGKLNIGATYGSEFTPNLNEEEKGGDCNATDTTNKRQKGKGPNVNIKAKKEH